MGFLGYWERVSHVYMGREWILGGSRKLEVVLCCETGDLGDLDENNTNCVLLAVFPSSDY